MMTPKEKAHDLLKKYFMLYQSYPYNKEGALITVSEIMALFNMDVKYSEEFTYWEEVYLEILSIDREITRGDSQEARADRFNEDL